MPLVAAMVFLRVTFVLEQGSGVVLSVEMRIDASTPLHVTRGSRAPLVAVFATPVC